jgi:hypothetical protein
MRWLRNDQKKGPHRCGPSLREETPKKGNAALIEKSLLQASRLCCGAQNARVNVKFVIYLKSAKRQKAKYFHASV